MPKLPLYCQGNGHPGRSGGKAAHSWSSQLRCTWSTGVKEGLVHGSPISGLQEVKCSENRPLAQGPAGARESHSVLRAGLLTPRALICRLLSLPDSWDTGSEAALKPCSLTLACSAHLDTPCLCSHSALGEPGHTAARLLQSNFRFSGALTLKTLSPRISFTRLPPAESSQPEGQTSGSV